MWNGTCSTLDLHKFHIDYDELATAVIRSLGTVRLLKNDRWTALLPFSGPHFVVYRKMAVLVDLIVLPITTRWIVVCTLRHIAYELHGTTAERSLRSTGRSAAPANGAADIARIIGSCFDSLYANSWSSLDRLIGDNVHGA